MHAEPKPPPPADQPPDLSSLVPLQSVLCTEELHRRPSRAPDHERENRALAALALALADEQAALREAQSYSPD